MLRIFAIMSTVLVVKSAAFCQTLTGKFEGPVSFKKVFLYQYSLYDNKFLKEDSAVIADGSFRFDFLPGNEPSVSFLRLKDDRNYTVWGKDVELFLAKDSIIVLAADSFKNARVLNSATNYEFAFYNEMLQPAREYYNSINLKTSKDMAGLPRDILASKEYGKFIQMRMYDSRKGLYRKYEEFVRNNPSSWVSLYALVRRMTDMNIRYDMAAELFSGLDEKLKQSPAGMSIAARVDKLNKLQIGLQAPPVRLPNTKGRMIDLKDYKRKYVLLEFWSSGCGACRFESPHLKEAFVKYREKGFDILSISLDDEKFKGRERWLEAIKKDGTDLWQQVSDLKGYKSPVVIDYDVHSIPQNYLVDPDGIIIAKNLRGANLHKKLEELFGF